MSLKSIFLLVFSLLLWQTAWAQPCSFTIIGRVIDEHDNTELAFAEIKISGTTKGAIADSLGYFELNGLCAGQLHLEIHHLGCDPIDTVVVLKDSLTPLLFKLEHHTELLKTVEIFEYRDYIMSNCSTINRDDALKDNGGQSLTKGISQMPGISVASTGTHLSKPMIDGLMGNRIALTNNGLRLEDQQWGADHAPSISLLNAGRVTVIRGSAAVLYGPEAASGSIDIKPALLPTTYSKVKGESFLFLGSNGRGGSAGLILEQRTKQLLGWRASASITRWGDQHTPDYVLSNTGLKAAELGALFEKKLKNNWGFEAQSNFYHSEPGILRAAHVGNLTDLQTAITADRPWYIQPFSYRVAPPRQSVQHLSQLLRWKYSPSMFNKYVLQFDAQLNNRREFDNRRNGRSDIPVLHLRLFTPSITLQNTRIREGSVLDIGAQWQTQVNFNVFGTGYLPILPDYDQHTIGVFVRKRLIISATNVEMAFRYDFRYLKTYLTRSGVVEVDAGYYRVGSAHFGADKNIKNHNINGHLSLSHRPPSVSELYSYGVHQSLASFEIGDPSLRPETSVKCALRDIYKRGDFEVEATTFVHQFRNFIYLSPQPEPILTIRGAFPAFKYVQNNAILGGATLGIRYLPTEHWNLFVQGSALRHRNLETKEPLIFQPADNVFLRADRIGKVVSFWASVRATREQVFVPIGQDYLLPPLGFVLFSGGMSVIASKKLKISLDANNLGNTVYRNYLNRLRYFADEPGTNIQLYVRYIW